VKLSVLCVLPAISTQNLSDTPLPMSLEKNKERFDHDSWIE